MTETETEIHTLLLVKGTSSAVVHVGERSWLTGSVVSACNGRTMFGYVVGFVAGHEAEVTCKRCAAKAAK